MAPCGGTKAYRFHFEADSGSQAYIAWNTVSPDEKGMCSLNLNDGIEDDEFKPLYPISGEGPKFPCGRTPGSLGGISVTLPKNMSCDSCILQLIWETKAGKYHMCSDIEIMNGKLDDCSG